MATGGKNVVKSVNFSVVSEDQNEQCDTNQAFLRPQQTLNTSVEKESRPKNAFKIFSKHRRRRNLTGTCIKHWF